MEAGRLQGSRYDSLPQAIYSRRSRMGGVRRGGTMCVRGMLTTSRVKNEVRGG